MDNGILVRSDMHALFDAGYLTVDCDRAGEPRAVVPSRLHEDFGNGRDCYPYHGRCLAVILERRSLCPARQYPGRHHENVFFG